MLLNEFLDNEQTHSDLLFLYFEGDELKCTDKLQPTMLNMEVMDCSTDEDYREVWLR